MTCHSKHRCCCDSTTIINNVHVNARASTAPPTEALSNNITVINRTISSFPVEIQYGIFADTIRVPIGAVRGFNTIDRSVCIGIRDGNVVNGNRYLLPDGFSEFTIQVEDRDISVFITRNGDPVQSTTNCSF